jgi:hypothetical protein
LPPPPPPPTTTQLHFECAKGEASDWSFPKKVFCCLTKQKGCPPPPQPPTQPLTLPPPTTVTTACPFDCDAGYNDLNPLQWVKGWPGAKKLYCCKTAHRGCPSELPPPGSAPPSGIPAEPDNGPYDCDAGYHPCFTCLQRQWSPMKLKWCCDHKDKGCKWNTPLTMDS